MQALSKALLELRAEMTSHAEQQIIANAAQKEESFNIQQIVDKQTKELKVSNLETNGECIQKNKVPCLYALIYEKTSGQHLSMQHTHTK